MMLVYAEVCVDTQFFKADNQPKDKTNLWSGLGLPWALTNNPITVFMLKIEEQQKE